MSFARGFTVAAGSRSDCKIVPLGFGGAVIVTFISCHTRKPLLRCLIASQHLLLARLLVATSQVDLLISNFVKLTG